MCGGLARKSSPDFDRGESDTMDEGELERLIRARGLQGRVLREEPLSRHTSYRIGGPADWYVAVDKQDQLSAWVLLAQEVEQPYLIIGRGTNLLAADKGFRGLIIENRCQRFTVDDASQSVHAEAGVLLALLARETATRGSAGLEWAVGIPGTVGGGIVNNAGAYEGAMADVVRQVTIMDRRGQIRGLAPEELSLGYRTSRFREQQSRGEAILSTDLSLSPESAEVLKERMFSYESLRRRSQPSKPSAGSVFRNPPGFSAGQLIEQAGLKGKRIGDAQVSPRHANYIVNLRSARATDVQRLIALIREEVRQRFDVELQLEIELVGEWVT